MLSLGRTKFNRYEIILRCSKRLKIICNAVIIINPAKNITGSPKIIDAMIIAKTISKYIIVKIVDFSSLQNHPPTQFYQFLDT